MENRSRINNFLSWFDLFEDSPSLPPLFWLIFGFIFLIVIESHFDHSVWLKYFIEIAVMIFVSVRVIRQAFYPKELSS